MNHNRKLSRRRISRTGKTPSTTPPGVDRKPTNNQLEQEMTLEMFVSTHSLPQRAKVTEGYDDTYNTDNSFSNGDVIEVRRVLCPFVTLTFQHPGTDCDVRLTVPTRNATRFKLCWSNDTQRKATVYGCVKQIVEFWPLAVMAKHKHKPRGRPCYNNVSIPANIDEPRDQNAPLFSQGDVLRVVRLDQSRDTDVPKVVVEFKNVSTLELFKLPVDYVGPFTEVYDNTRPYTLGELADMARVPRKLRLSMSDQPQLTDDPNSTYSSSSWIPGIPRDFDGVINVEKPDYLVEISIVTDMEDDYEEVEEVLEEERGTDVETGKYGKKWSDGVSPRFLVPIDSGINLTACEADYVCLSHKQCPLEQLSRKPESALPRMAQIIHWDEETTILQHHLIRPGDVIVLYRLETLVKLAVKVGSRRFLLPVNHPSRFRLVNKSSSGSIKCCQLSEILAKQKNFPFSLILDESTNIASTADEDILPRKTVLKVQSLVEELTVVVAKISCGDHLRPAFHLPLRTRLDVCFMSRWRGSTAVHVYSRWDGMAEEISKQVYDDVTGQKSDDYLEPIAVFPPPTQKPPNPSKKDDIPSRWPQPPPPLTPPLIPLTPPLPPLTPPSKRGGTLGVKQAPPLPPRDSVMQRSATLPLNLTGVTQRSRSTSSDTLTSPRSPGLEKFLQLVKEKPLRSWSFDSDIESSDDSDYERIDDDAANDVIEDGYVTASQAHQSADEESTDLIIPEDGNVCSFSAAQMQLLLRQLNAPLETLQTWNKLAVDGRKFAEMTDDTLAGFRVNKSLIRYFRDRSRLDTRL